MKWNGKKIKVTQEMLDFATVDFRRTSCNLPIKASCCVTLFLCQMCWWNAGTDRKGIRYVPPEYKYLLKTNEFTCICGGK